MKKNALFAAGALLLAVSLPSFADEETRETCAVETLRGSYLYLTQGYFEGQPYASSGIMSFNGTGQVTLIYTRSIERAQLYTNGTYTLNANCSGSMKLATGTVNDFYVSPAGDSFNWVRGTGHGAVGGEAKRVTLGQIVKQR